MRLGQRQKTPLEGLEHFLVRCSMQGLYRNRLNSGERVLCAVVQLVEEKPQAFFLLRKRCFQATALRSVSAG
jgi:hypothetical protein